MSTKLVGKITREQNQWFIQCEPNVRNRMRRVFPQVTQYASDTITISDNIENCRDLLWFMERYPMDIEDIDYLKQRANDHVFLGKSILAILDNNCSLRDFELAQPARNYQKTGSEMLLTVKGLLLADDVGLGKTLTSFLAMCLPENLPALFVTLPNLPRQMEAQLAKFLPNHRPHIIKKGTPYPLAKPGEPMPDVIFCSYSKLRGWAEILKHFIRYVVFDEIQELRTGEESQKYHAARHVASGADLRLGLSATPIYNMGAEFFNVLDVLRPGCLGSRDEFQREWCTGEKKIKDPKAFGAYLRSEGLMLRRTRAEVNRELPPVEPIVLPVESDATILDQITGSAVELAKIILSANEAFRGQKMRATEEFNVMMRQATGIAKAVYVAEFVSLLVESGESVVLYGWHREVYNIWLERLAKHKPVMYTGSESPARKEQAKQSFLNEESEVIIISLRAGAGLDGLQYHPRCRTAVFGELDWSPGVHEQCIGRLARDGQDKSIAAYFTVADSGSDPVIADILGIKRSQIQGVRDPNSNLFEKLETDSGGIKRLAENYLSKVQRIKNV
ncbi:DEAD/DEAH box helicase [Acerihabitans sp. TG2]|uniref:DEAD/DEAH box helicase n=1 Tax=Acerihabitans sp. TG2 TaxID=3096008 RepID=UPI002B2317E1|nr:DEAD/DEAH box helicase [Acerihabitans sp. TG2]MEA9392158.1 DEAD/DEAH box helicase [Acerihabitans sp. TG2]